MLQVLRTSGIEEKSVHEIIRIVEAKEAARDAASSIRPTTAAATSSLYKKASKQEAGSKPQQPPRQSAGPPNGTRPKKLIRRCGNEYADFAVWNNGSYNLNPYESCRDCFLANKKPAIGGRKSVAANTPSRPAFEAQPSGHSPTREVRISSAKVARTNARLCG